MSEYRNLAKNTVIFAVGQFSVKVIQFFLMPLLTVAMTTEDYGSAETIASMVELLIPLFTLGLQDAVFRFCMRKDMDGKAVLSSTMAVVAVGGLLIIGAAAIAIIFWEYQLCILFALLYVGYSLSNIWGQYIRGVGKIKTFAACGVLQALALAGGMATFVYWLQWGAVGYLLSMVLAYFCSLLPMFFIGQIYRNISFKAIDKDVLKQMLKFALPLIPNAISWWFIQVVNRYLIVFFNGESAAGLFISSAKIATIINILGTVFMQAWTISAVRSLDDKQKGEFNSHIYSIFSAFIQFVALIVLLILPFLSKFLLQGEFYVAWRYSAFAIFTAILSCYASFFGAFYGANMNTKMNMFSTLTAAIVNTLSGLLLVWKFGVIGALYASMLAYAVLAIFRMITTMKYSLIKINWVKEIIAIAIVFADAFLITYFTNLSTLWYYLIQAILIIVFCIVKAKDLFRVVKSVIEKMRTIRAKPSVSGEEQPKTEDLQKEVSQSAEAETAGEVIMNNNVKAVQSVQLNLLEVFAAVCEKLNLRYSLSAGTLLGAVRHGGFIPWDDDVDVTMLRDEYEKFIEEAPKLLPQGYFLQHYKTEKGAPNFFAKLRNSNTTWICYEHEKLDINHGIGMDIFPVDKFDDAGKLKSFVRKAKRFWKINGCYDNGYIKTITKGYKRAGARIIHVYSRLKGRKRILKGYDDFVSKYKVGRYTTADTILKNKLIPSEIYDEYKTISFEGKEFMCIKHPEIYLSAVYGDNYMEIPPKDKRVIHLAKYVDCNKPYKEFIGELKKK